jgi:error-prone DNA polymerase
MGSTIGLALAMHQRAAMLIPIHAKSDRSLGYGTATPRELVAAAARMGLPALALTDLETLAGQVEFHVACKAHGIKPITGLELRAGGADGVHGRRRGRLVLLARDLAGYAALCRLASVRATGSCEDEVADVLRDAATSLFVLTDDSAALERLLALSVPREALGLLLVRPALDAQDEARRVAIARGSGVRVIADADVVLISPADHPLHALQVAVHHRQTVRAARLSGRIELPARALVEQVFGFRDMPAAIESAAEIADACTLDLLALRSCSDSQAEEADALARMEARCAEVGTPSRAHAERLARELAVVRRLRLARYFVAALEVVDEARHRSIPIVARGSAVGSLIVHQLGMSPIDPLAHGLLFERFVHEDRSELPDIDLDVAHDQRDDLIDWLTDRRGTDHVSPIASYATWKRRSAYPAALTALGASPLDVARTIDAIPDDDLELPVPDHALPPELRAARPLIERLITRPSHLSVHASGIALSTPALSSFVPFARAPKTLVTQYDARSLEALGILKLDLLGNRALTERVHTLKTVGQPGDAELPRDDVSTWTRLQQADTLACFQIESPLVRAALRKQHVRSLEDLSAVLARVRPGPSGGLSLIYEEQVIERIAGVLGCSLARADALRRAIVHGELDEARFIAEAAHAGRDLVRAKRAWAELVGFAAYAFSKAHASSFARLAYDSAYLKTHHTQAFAAAVLDHHGGMYPLRTLVADFQRNGVRFVVPSVQSAQRCSTLRDGAVEIGLDHIKHLTQRSKDALLRLRPFDDLQDLLVRANPSQRERIALVKSGACDELPPLDRDDFPFAHDYWLDALQRGGGLSGPIPSFHPASAEDATRVSLYRALTRVQAELELLGMHVSDHPMRLLRPEATRVGCISSAELPRRVGSRVRFAGLICALRNVVTRSGALMCFATFEDELGLVEATVPAAALARLRDRIRNPGPYLITGRPIEQRGSIQFVVEQLMPFHLRQRASA